MTRKLHASIRRHLPAPTPKPAETVPRYRWIMSPFWRTRLARGEPLTPAEAVQAQAYILKLEGALVVVAARETGDIATSAAVAQAALGYGDD